MPADRNGQRRPSLFVIDGHAHIYRAYYAPFRDLTSPTGEPTKATFVFTQMLLQLIEARRPDYLCMAIDSGDETVFRKAIDPNYKATRQAPPEDFKPQEQRILQLVRDAGVPILCKPGFEADDIIATLARRYGPTHNVFMVSKDKDLRQVIGNGVCLYDVTKDEVLDETRMFDKVGYTPEQAVDVQALMGDNIDNVPGVPGVGEKTAAKLVGKYGSADAVFDHVDEMTPKQKENFKAHGRDKLDISRKLVRLRDDLPLEDFDLDAARFTTLATPALCDHLDELGFRSLLARLGEPAAADRDTPRTPDSPQTTKAGPKYAPLAGGLFAEPVSPSTDTTFETIDTPDKLATFVDTLRSVPVFAFDTETDALSAVDSNLVGMSFAWEAGKGYYLPVRGPLGETVLDPGLALEMLRPILESADHGKVGHHIKYDQLVLRAHGVALRGVRADTMLMAFLLDAGRNTYKLDTLAAELLGYTTVPITDLIGKGKKQLTMDAVPVDAVAHYAAEDAFVTWRLFETLSPKLDAFPELRALHDAMELPLVAVLADMEWHGVRVDPAVLAEQSDVLATRISALRTKIAAEAGGVGGGEMNPDSPKQLQEVLFNKLGLRPVRKTKTGHSTDAATLDILAAQHPLPGLILEYRSLVKLKETYLDNLAADISPRTGRIHTSFNQTAASTGRLSSSDPSLQNIPVRTDEGRRIRSAFVPDEPGDVLLTADYSQIELRVLAHFTGEKRLVDAFNEDLDIHRAVAADVYKVPADAVTDAQRRTAKTINFAIIYGVSAFGLARRIEGLSQKAAGELINTYKRNYPRVFDFFEQCVADAKVNGYVSTLRGRRRPIPEIDSRIASMRQYSERTAINSVIQGSAADLIKLAMLRVHDRMKREQTPARLLLQVHDELVFECPEASAEALAAMAKQEMEAAMTLAIPLRVDAGWAKNWREAK